MANDWLRTRFLFSKEFDSDFIESLLDHCLNIGCTTRRDGSTDICTFSSPGGYRRQEESTAEAIQQLSNHQEGSVELWYGELRISLKLNPNDSNVRDDIPLISVGVMNSQFKLSDKYPEEEVQGRVNQMVDFVEAIAEFTKPAFAYVTTETADRSLNLTTTDLREGRYPSCLTWLMVFPDRMIDRIGRERLQAAPAWEVRTLETGSIMLIITNNPVHPDHEWTDNHRVVSDYFGWDMMGSYHHK